MRPTSPQEIQSAIKTFESMRDTGALSINSFYKCMVTLASEWLIHHDDTEQTLILLNKCPPSYYGKDLIPQMKVDSLFAVAVVELTYKILQYGIIDFNLHPPTMPVAKA